MTKVFLTFIASINCQQGGRHEGGNWLKLNGKVKKEEKVPKDLDEKGKGCWSAKGISNCIYL